MKNIVLFADEKCMTSRVYLRTFLSLERDLQAVIVLKRIEPKNNSFLKTFFKKVKLGVKIFIDLLCDKCFRLFLSLPNQPQTLEDLISAGGFLRHTFQYTNINDFENHELSETYKSSIFLYTNGGILNEAILTKLNFIHIHPGCVPEVRGSDGLLWSVDKFGFPTCSLIEMSKKIDAGKVLLRCALRDFELPKFIPLLFRIAPQRAYAAMLNTLDSELRALVLSQFLDSEKNFGNGVWDSTLQDENLQETFFWMHPKVRLLVLKDWVNAANGREIKNLHSSTHGDLVPIDFR